MIVLKNIVCGYDERIVLNDISLEISDGEFTVLMGPNGSGKSTLLYSILNFIPLNKGSIEINGLNLREWKLKDLARQIAYIPQELILQFDYRVLDLVQMGRYPQLEMFQSYSHADAQAAKEALQWLDLLHLQDRYYSQLSGGEKQRVLLARALVQQAKTIILDESLSQLDLNHQVEMMRCLYQLNKQEGIGIILVSHNINLAVNFCSQMLIMNSGRIVASGKPETLMTEELLSEVFGIKVKTGFNTVTQKPNILYPGVNE